MNKLFAICGLKNSGKNEVANMMEFILNTPSCFHKFWFYHHMNFLKNINNKYTITSFAHPLKRTLAALLNIDIKKFDDRNFKENYYIYFPTLNITNSPNKDLILSDNKFIKFINYKDFSFLKENYITIRQLLQIFGTECMRNIFGDKLWILSTLKNNKNLIISDTRFKVEVESINNNNGITIYINRKECLPGNHSSEKEIYDLYSKNEFKYIINNNGTIKELFYKTNDLIKQF